MKRKSEREASKSTSVPAKKAKINEETAKSTSVSHQKPATQRKKPAASRQQPPSAATLHISTGSKKRRNLTDDEGTDLDEPKSPVPPLKKPRGKNSDIARKSQPVRRTGITL